MSNRRNRFAFFSAKLRKAAEQVPAANPCSSDSASSLSNSQDRRSWMSCSNVNTPWPDTTRHPSADSSATDVSMEALDRRATHEEAQRPWPAAAAAGQDAARPSVSGGAAEQLLNGRYRVLKDLARCDFGFSKDTVGQSTCKSSCGTPEYIAPELLFQGKYDGTRADTWSCGVSLYVLLTGRFPFSWPGDADLAASNVKRMQKMFARITAGDYIPVPEVSWECQELITRMLQPAPERRATAAEVMQHPWFAAGFLRPLAGINQRLLARSVAAAAAGQTCRQSSTELLDMVATCKIARAPEQPMRKRMGRVPGAHERR